MCGCLPYLDAVQQIDGAGVKEMVFCARKFGVKFVFDSM